MSQLKKIVFYVIIFDSIGGFFVIIFGLDPGIAIVGYGIIEAIGNRVRLIDYGVIETKAGIPLPDRLKIIDEELNKLIELHNVDDLAIEELFFNKNVKTVINVAQARGVEILSFTKKNILAITGYGRADKKQMQESIKIIFKLKAVPKPDDAADALAIALCHFFSLKFKEQFRMK